MKKAPYADNTGMLSFRFLISVCLGTLAYVVISIFGGQDGIWAYRQLEEQKQVISANLFKIEEINNRLQQEMQELQYDPAAIAAHARKLGYVADNETLVKISGLKPLYEPTYDAGTMVRREALMFIPEWACKCFGLLVAVLSLVTGMLWGNTARRSLLFARRIRVEQEEESDTQYSAATAHPLA